RAPFFDKMEISEIPFNYPIILQSIRTRKNLQCPPGLKNARCLEDNRDYYEQLYLHHIGGRK
ncbi:hypothetical protein F441_23136, partial [Phytophthora nicotianae CJ01A1]